MITPNIICGVVSCVYKIWNTKNNKVYIGSTGNLYNRLRYHIWRLNNNKHENKILQEDWNLFGKECFYYEILEIGIKDKMVLRDLENKWMNINRENLYNICQDARDSRGYKHSDNSKQKISDVKTGQPLTESQLKGLEFGRGKKYWTKETYKKLKECKQGEKCSTSKLTEKDVIEMLKMIKNKVSYKVIKEKYNISLTQISRIKSGLRWGYLKERYGELYE